MNVFFLPVGNNDLHANPPSANLSGCAIAESGFCGDPAVGGALGRSSKRNGYEETMYKSLMGLGSLAARNDFTPLKKPPPKREPFFTRSK